MEAALIGFGGCGKNMIDAFCRDNPDIGQIFLVSRHAEEHGKLPNFKIMRQSSPADFDSLATKLGNAEICFLLGGLGGTSCADMPILGQKLRKIGILTIALVTFPFRFENLAEEARACLAELEGNVDAFIVFENDELPGGKGLNEGLDAAAQNMRHCIQTIMSGNNDVADLKVCLHGRVFYGLAQSGEDMVQAARGAVAAIGKALPCGRRTDAILMGITSADDLAPLIGIVGMARSLLDMKNAKWFVSFESPGQNKMNRLIFLASLDSNH